MTDIQAIADSGPTIETALTYTTDTGVPLAYQITESSEGEDDPLIQERYVVHPVSVHDVRPFTNTLSLDREGFILRRSASAVTDFFDTDEVNAVYNPEIERLVKQETGAEKVVIFDHTIRVQSDEKRRAMKAREIVNLAHNDYTVKSGPQRVRDQLEPDEAERRLQGRFAIYNLWRSIAGTVQSAPLTICDARSVKHEDWVLCDLVYSDRVGEIYNLAHNVDHRWCYFPNMEADEVMMFKSYESMDDGRARFTPHTSFVDPSTPDGAPPRESIETRVLAFFPADA